MFTKVAVLCLLIGASFAADAEDEKDLIDSSETANSKREAPISTSYGPPSGDKEPAPVYGPPSHTSPHSHSSPSYSKSIPAAAIRNVETVAVTKTITPVVTKTTTYNTHSEPALSIGHVQGYSHSAVGQPKIAPVQFQTQYTTYNNPTVGVNGPVTYTGPAVVVGGAGGQQFAIPLSGLTTFATGNGAHFTLASGSPSPVYGAPAAGGGSPASTYGPPGQIAGSPLGSHSNNVPQYVSARPATSAASAPQHALSLHNIQQLQKLRAPAPYSQQFSASSVSPVAIRPAPSNPFTFMQARPIGPFALQSSPSNSIATALRYQPQQSLNHPQSIYHQRYQQPQQPLAQPTVQYVQTYAMPSISYTRLQPVSELNKHLLPSQQYAQLTKAIRQ